MDNHCNWLFVRWLVGWGRLQPVDFLIGSGYRHNPDAGFCCGGAVGPTFKGFALLIMLSGDAAIDVERDDAADGKSWNVTNFSLEYKASLHRKELLDFTQPQWQNPKKESDAGNGTEMPAEFLNYGTRELGPRFQNRSVFFSSQKLKALLRW